MLMKSYSELIKLRTFKERFDYLKLNGVVASETFGRERYLNQAFYTSDEWKRIRNKVIVRDMGCDLGIEGRELPKGLIVIHHINPITLEDILNRNPALFDLENLISCWTKTHTAIHYGDERVLDLLFTERKPGDTCPWR